MMWLLLSLVAHADEVHTFFGGGVDVFGGISRKVDNPTLEGFDGKFGMNIQPEFDFRLENKWLFIRLDVDVAFDPFTNEITMTPPEWAMIQVGNERVRGRLGILNPNIGLEDWDRWNNYLPSYSLFFNAASPGRIAGGEIEVTAGDAEVFAWGGYDMDFGSPTFGVGVAAERDTWATWTGFAGYPTDAYYGLFYAFEFYPHDLVWLDLDGGIGVSGTAPFLGVQAVVNVMPEWYLQPVVRGEVNYDKDGAALGGPAAGVANGTASIGARIVPTDAVKIMVEGKGIFTGGQFAPAVYMSVDIFNPEPPYHHAYEEDTDVPVDEGGVPADEGVE